MRLPLVLLTFLVFTPTLGGLVVVASLLGVRDRPGGVYDWAARSWTRILCAAAGVRIVLHDAERMHHGSARVFAANHVSWYDVFSLASVLPFTKFVAKTELFRIPIFGRAARAVGSIPIDRDNRKAAFGAYDEAAKRIRGGSSVIVFPEGTRGRDYRLRPFKKGPFVLAIAAQAPIVPTIVHGTIAVQPRDSWRINPGRVDVHFLEPVETVGMGYEDRDRLSREVWTRMATALHELYGVESQLPSHAGHTAAAG
ncbi:MAG TPA: lysophospholipid acyltransferase family protein [Gemmatimonadaceae bacterium]|nr:lysophospholipid acyltransferase family protein [Gemmatimonadaceae bacterium]